MKFAYYEVVSSQQEKKLRLQEIEESVGKDPDYYSSYLEVAPVYNASWKQLRALCALKAAVRKKKIQLLVIPSLENLHMSENRTVNLLLDFMDKGVQIALENPENIQTEEKILALAQESRLEYINTVLSIPLIRMERCVVQFFGESAFLYLEKDVPKEGCFGYSEKMLFIDAVRKFQDAGFFLYRADMQAWYHIPCYMAAVMIDTYEIAYKTLYEAMNLELLLP